MTAGLFWKSPAKCRPGSRLYFGDLPTTAGAVLEAADGEWVVLTAGHTFRDFDPQQDEIDHYIPVSDQRRFLGNVRSFFEEPGIDLGIIVAADPARIAAWPVDRIAVPKLLAEDNIESIVGLPVWFRGGIQSRIDGTLEGYRADPTHGRSLAFRGPNWMGIMPGDSGGPLYFETQENLHLVGTLIGGFATPEERGILRFLHPGRALARAGLRMN
jgi:hypothetical protein